MIATEPTPAHHPGESALDGPSSGEGTKARREEGFPVSLFALRYQQSPPGEGERLDNLDLPPQDHPGPCTEGAAVVTVCPNQLETGKHFLFLFMQIHLYLL